MDQAEYAMRIEGARLVLDNATQYLAALWISLLGVENGTEDATLKVQIRTVRQELWKTFEAVQAERNLYLPSVENNAPLFNIN